MNRNPSSTDRSSPEETRRNVSGGWEEYWISPLEKAKLDAACGHPEVVFLYVFKVYDPHLDIGECQSCHYRVCRETWSQSPQHWHATAQQFRRKSNGTQTEPSPRAIKAIREGIAKQEQSEAATRLVRRLGGIT